MIFCEVAKFIQDIFQGQVNRKQFPYKQMRSLISHSDQHRTRIVITFAVHFAIRIYQSVSFKINSERQKELFPQKIVFLRACLRSSLNIASSAQLFKIANGQRRVLDSQREVIFTQFIQHSLVWFEIRSANWLRNTNKQINRITDNFATFLLLFYVFKSTYLLKASIGDRRDAFQAGYTPADRLKSIERLQTDKRSFGTNTGVI